MKDLDRDALRDRLPADTATVDPGDADGAGAPEAPASLSAVPSTLAIPLAARAHGDAMFPAHAQHDRHALRLLQALGVDAAPYLADRPSIFGMLARTAVFRRCASEFFEHTPGATGVVLGAGLSHYHQWLDNGRNAWIDVDLPEVTALRDRWLPVDPGAAGRRVNASADLTSAGWWEASGLPSGDHAPLLLAIAEGLVMYLEPEQVRRLLQTFGEQAAPGTRLLVDSFCWLAIGREKRHPSVRHTAARFRFGLRRPDELTRPHPRLHLRAVHPVMEAYGPPYSLLWPAFRWFTGVPFYAVYELGVDG